MDIRILTYFLAVAREKKISAEQQNLCISRNLLSQNN